MTGRYTPPEGLKDTTALWEKWCEVDPFDERMNPTGRAMAAAAHLGKEKFDQLVRELRPEV